MQFLSHSCADWRRNPSHNASSCAAACKLLRWNIRQVKARARASRERGRCHSLGVKSIRSEEHTSELQSLMRISYAVFCLKKKKNDNKITKPTHITHIRHT